jgi:hypothetical protein
MKILLTIFLFFGINLSIFAQDISTSQKRTEVLDLARTLLTSKSIQVDASVVSSKNPFNPQALAAAGIAVDQTVGPVAMTDRGLLTAMAGLVTPSGSMRLGDTPILLFGQKKLKVGDVLPIFFQGVMRELVITSIEPTNFTLRLNNEEITRPIKPSANKP